MKFKKTILENGLTIIHEQRDIEVTTLMLAARYGAAYETKEEKGIAHFMEHLCFKGTEKRDVHQIAEEIESLGGDLNAFTHEEVTAYYAKLPSKHLHIAADVIFDVFFNPTFPEEEVAKEGNVICEEIKMYKDNPRAHTLDELKGCLYKEPFGMNIAGTEENVRGMTREQLINKHREIYTPKNAILCVVGNNTHEEVLELAKKHCLERTYKPVEAIPTEPITEAKEETRNNLNQTNLAMGLHFPKGTDKTKYAAELFSTILGQGMSSRLFREVREKRGLVYTIQSHVDLGKHYGYFFITAGTDPTKKEEVYKICEEEYKKMEHVTEKEIEEAKKRIIGSRIVDNETSNEVAIHLLLEEINGNAEEYYQFEKNITEVQGEDVRNLAKKTTFSKFSLGPNQESS